MAVNLSPIFGAGAQLFNNNGDPLAGGKIFTYLAGTTTNGTTFTNSAGSIAHSNPIILDAAGRVPTGEIWLSDSLTYKFVVKDSADNLIGTYDNLVGINSNFVNFTNQQEIQTASAGQTVFNLNNIQYQPGTHSLSVFVDGVNQYGPGAQYAYVETDSDTVTFVSGLHLNASVKFTTSQLNTSGGVDSNQVSYLYPATNSVAQNVKNRLSQEVFLSDFGKNGELVKNMNGVTAATTGNTLFINGYFANGDGGAGEFYWDAMGSKTLHNGGTIIDPNKTFPTNWSDATQRQAWFTAAVGGVGIWRRVIGDYISLRWFGAVGDFVQDDQESVDAFIKFWIPSDMRGYVPAGRYKCSGRILFDITQNPNRRLPELFGDGPYTSKFFSQSTVSPAISFYGSSAGPDHFQAKLFRVGFETDTPSVGTAIGLSDFSDNHGNYDVEQCFFVNYDDSGSFGSVGLQLNWLFDCHFTNNVILAYPMQGTALEVRRCHFCQFDGGSYSNAYFAIYIKDGGSYNVTFNTPDIENVVHGLYVTDATAEYIKFNNGYMDIWNPLTNSYPAMAYPVYIGAINTGGLIIDNVRVGRQQSELYDSGLPGWQGFISPSTMNYTSLLIRGFYRYQTTPAVPASDIAQFNYTGQIQRVRVWGGTVTRIFFNGTETLLTSGEFILNPADFIAIRYSSVPTWTWKAQP